MKDTVLAKVSQWFNRTGGDSVGRDKITKIYNRSHSQIAVLNEKYLEECDSKTEVYEFIKALLHYTTRDTKSLHGLEEKLLSAERDDDFIEFAKEHKELFAKRLLKRDLSLAAQRIFAYLLGKTKASFVYNVIPIIKSGANREKIDSAIYSNVLEPIFNELEDNVLDLTMDEIVGMLFYLTGNCHINWTKEC